MRGVIYFVYQDIKIADWQDCIHSTVDKVDFSGAFALSRGNIDKISVLAGVPAGVSITTVLSFGREVSDKSIRLLTDSFRFSLGLNRTLPFRSLRWKTFKFVAIYSVLKTRAQMHSRIDLYEFHIICTSWRQLVFAPNWEFIASKIPRLLITPGA